MQREICKKTHILKTALLIPHFCPSLDIKNRFPHKLRVSSLLSLWHHVSHTEDRNTMPTPAFNTLKISPPGPGILCPSPPLPQFRRDPAGHGDLPQPFSVSSLCAILRISLFLLLTHTNTPVFLTLLMVYSLKSTRQKLKFNYSSCDERSPVSGDRKVISLKIASDARWLFSD